MITIMIRINLKLVIGLRFIKKMYVFKRKRFSPKFILYLMIVNNTENYKIMKINHQFDLKE